MKKIVIVVSIFMLTGNLLCQQPWKTDGNNLAPGDFLGSKNATDVDIKSNNQSRLQILSNGKIIAKNDFTVQGVTVSDSLVSNKGAHIFGQLHVGTNSAVFGNSPIPIPHDYYTSSIGTLVMGNAYPYTFGPPPKSISDIVVGVGIQTPQHKIHVADNPLAGPPANVRMAFTNANTANNATDGTLIGILANGTAEIRQQEALPLNFYTSNLQRATILANGRTGVGNVNPLNRLVVTSAAADPGGGSAATAGGSSGIRTTNMTAATPTVANPGNGVLSVNAAGDIIYVHDGGGSTGTVSASCKNGLNNTVGAPDIELGGNLIRNTDVTMENSGGTVENMAFNGKGKFLISDGLAGSNNTAANTTLDYKTGIFQNNFDRALRIEMLRSPQTTQQVGIYDKVDVDANGNNAVIGVFSDVLGDTGPNAGIFGLYGDANSRTLGGSNSANGVVGHASNATQNLGGDFTADGDPGYGTVNSIGVEGRANYGSNQGIGGFFRAFRSSNRNIGVQAEGINFTGSFNPRCYGMRAIATTATTDWNIGTVGYADNSSNSIGAAGIIDNSNFNLFPAARIAVYGYNPASGATGNWAGYFEGDVYINGPASGFSPVIISDQMFKTDIDTISNARNIIKQLKPRSFYFDTTNANGIRFSGKKQYGFVAQDVQTVLPELVGSTTKPATKDSLGNIVTASVTYKNLNYDAFIAILMKGMQEQDKRIDSLTSVLSSSSSRMSNPVNNSTDNNSQNSTSLNKQNVTLKNVDALVLDQNQPNPFSESTVIKYNVPEKYGYAQLIFTTAEGRILKTIDITEKGPGEITVFANDLSNGIYSYTLVVDGKTIDTKKMVKQ